MAGPRCLLGVVVFIGGGVRLWRHLLCGCAFASGARHPPGAVACPSGSVPCPMSLCTAPSGSPQHCVRLRGQPLTRALCSSPEVLGTPPVPTPCLRWSLASSPSLRAQAVLTAHNLESLCASKKRRGCWWHSAVLSPQALSSLLVVEVGNEETFLVRNSCQALEWVTQGGVTVPGGV